MKRLDRTKFTDIERNNYVALIANQVVVTVMAVMCILNTITTQGSVAYLLAYLILGYVPNIYGWIAFKKNTKTTQIKHVFGIGFAIFYSFALFTSFSYITFLFVIPLLVIVPVYNDPRYTILLNIGTSIEAICVCAYNIKKGGPDAPSPAEVAITISVMIMIGIASYFAAQTMNRNLGGKMKVIKSVSEETEKGIANVHTKLARLHESSKSTKAAMSEVSSGTNDTATAVQHQLLQTEQITSQVELVNATAKTMSEDLQKTVACVEAGNQDMDTLVKKVEVSVENSTQAIEKLNELTHRMQEMNGIVKLIDSIAFQTNILSLNANVEAARAGEAGRGFAVVATEVSAMSVRTKEATESISTMIDHMSASIKEVVNVMNQMIGGISEEREVTNKTFESFAVIQSSAQTMQENVTELVDNLKNLTYANQEISNSIQTISAASEEVSALANEAMESEEQNFDILSSIAEQMEELMTVVDQMHQTEI